VLPGEDVDGDAAGEVGEAGVEGDEGVETAPPSLLEGSADAGAPLEPPLKSVAYQPLPLS